MRRIAFIMPQFPRYDETFIMREILELSKDSLDLYIFSLQPSKDTIAHTEFESLSNKVYNANFLFSWTVLFAQIYFLVLSPLKYISTFFYILAKLFLSRNYLFKAIAIFPKSVYFAKLAKEKRINHIHAYWATTPTVTAIIIKRLINIDFSFTGHAHDIYVDTKMLEEKIEQAKFVTTCTEYNRRYLLGLMNGYQRSDKIIVSYHGVDLEKFNGKVTKSPSHQVTSKFRILSVGSLLECKGFDVLIEACKTLKDGGLDFECTIAGGGPLEEKLKSKIKNAKLEDCVKLTGYITQDALIPLYQQSDVFALPVKLDIHWGIPNVLLEAMACAVPVITTNLPSIPELIKDKQDGLIVPEKDPYALAGAIKLFYQDKDLRLVIGKNGKLIIQEKFDLRKNVAKMRNLFV